MLADLIIWDKDGVEYLARWGHFLAGITWIGLLYYFNFVQGPYFNKDADAGARSDATQKLVPRALWWFRWGAMFTFLTGVVMIGMMNETRGETFWQDLPVSEAHLILVGGLLGTLMFLNVWLIIWPNQKVVIANAVNVSGGAEADPAAGPAARKAFIASRTNTLFSVPMLFFMGAAAHLPFDVDLDNRLLFWIVSLVVIALLELNAIFATQGPTVAFLEKHRDTIIGGFLLTVIFYVLIEGILKL